MEATFEEELKLASAKDVDAQWIRALTSYSSFAIVDHLGLFAVCDARE